MTPGGDELCFVSQRGNLASTGRYENLSAEARCKRLRFIGLKAAQEACAQHAWCGGIVQDAGLRCSTGMPVHKFELRLGARVPPDDIESYTMRARDPKGHCSILLNRSTELINQDPLLVQPMASARTLEELHSCGAVRRNRTIWMLGNSVMRERYFAAAQLLGSSDAATNDLNERRARCGRGTPWKDHRPGQSACWGGECHCSSFSPALGIRLVFMWQQRVFDEDLAALLINGTAVGQYIVRAHDVILLSSGLHDIADVYKRPRWAETQRSEAPRLASVLAEARAYPLRLHVAWATTRVCNAYWDMSYAQLSGFVDGSNGIIMSALASHRVPVLDIDRVDACRNGCHSDAAATADSTASESWRACTCRGYKDHVHPGSDVARWHVEQLLRHATCKGKSAGSPLVSSTHAANGCSPTA